MTRISRVLALIVVAGVLTGCQTISPHRSFSVARDAESAAVVVTDCSSVRAADVEQALRCAGAMEREYVTTGDAVASQQKKYRYGEIALGTITLGLATFEANIDTLKAIGLASGATEATKSSQQYTARLTALDEGSRRFRCVHEKGTKAHDLSAEATSTLQKLNRLLAGEAPPALAPNGTDAEKSAAASAHAAVTAKRAQALHFLTQAAALPTSNRLRDAIMDAIRAVEVKAIRALRFEANPADDIATLKKAIEDAVKLGKEKAAEEEAVHEETKEQNAAVRLNAELLLDTTSAYDQALIELAACPAS